MSSGLTREVRRLMKVLASDHGCTVTRNKSSHWKVTRPGCQPVFVSCSQSNATGYRNAVADLRRILGVNI